MRNINISSWHPSSQQHVECQSRSNSLVKIDIIYMPSEKEGSTLLFILTRGISSREPGLFASATVNALRSGNHDYQTQRSPCSALHSQRKGCQFVIGTSARVNPVRLNSTKILSPRTIKRRERQIYITGNDERGVAYK